MSAAKKVAVIDDPVGQKGVLFASERYVERASNPQPKLRITLYPPDGEPEVYDECKIVGALMPELEFKGRLQEKWYTFDTFLGIPKTNSMKETVFRRWVHVTATTLPYKIEALTDVVN